jgi:hypothetical protein
MIDAECFEVEDVERVRSLAADHPLRVHARTCPRCSALLEEYQLYRDMRDPPAGSNANDAERRLTAALARELGSGARVTDLNSARAAREPKHAASRGWALPAWAAAAAALVVAGIWVWSRPDHDRPLILRGGSNGATQVRVEEATVRDGRLMVRWHSWPGAASYVVRYFSQDLEAIGASAPSADTTLTIAISALPAARGAHHALILRVAALRNGDTVAVSSAKSIELR